jgi:DNA-binding NarL/FixJ family response regulator
VNPITVILADDHAMVREGLLSLLNLEDDIKIVGLFENGLEAVAAAGELSPDVIVMDISMPLLNGIEATRQIIKATPTARILLLSAHSDDAYVDQARALGGSGYVLKQAAARVLPEAIREVHKGNTFYHSLAREASVLSFGDVETPATMV